MRHLNNGTDHRHSKSRCDQSSPARRTIRITVTEKYAETVDVVSIMNNSKVWLIETVSLEDTFCDTVQAPSGAGDMQLI